MKNDHFKKNMNMLSVTLLFSIIVAGNIAAEYACLADDNTAFFCNDLVTASCRLNGSMTCISGVGLLIGADDITIDGAGFILTGDRENLSCGGDEASFSKHSGVVNKEYDNVTIENLEITNFCTGIVIGEYPPVVDNMTLLGCTIHDCGKSADCTHGIHIIGANNCTITGNNIYNIDGQGVGGGCGGGGNGIFMYGVNRDRGNQNTITCNNLSYNIKSGFFMKKQCMYNNISNNIATENYEGGIVLMCVQSNYNVIEGNNASRSGSGIVIGGSNNTIRYNSALNNRYFGIKMSRNDGSYNNELYGNIACGNGYVDIKTCGHECYGNHGDDNTCNTTSNYDDTGTTGCTYSCGTQESKPEGDLNGDGKVTPADAVVALQMAVSGECSEDADVSGDHTVTSLDALMILQMAAEEA
ncbi:MAG: hypothetical protein DRP15_03625 [Candidatus Aenigmatarchaeota archaeon]|nr:MAG: hypothetical protein DRP15_03625 [Candidatus Aenigmarchaeota archaeon]